MRGANVFEVENLKCEYETGKTVLQIDKLAIPQGSLVFIVGKSGIGKSTLIETLGLMNNTIAPNKETRLKFFSNSSDSTSQDVADFWDRSDNAMSEFRKQNLSFIFQNTNLMENFSAGENMMVNLLINGVSSEKAKQRVLEVMKTLSLEEVLFDRDISALSGGQRQRLAFVRAITAEFTVLFGDEPTGNLDEATAGELMSSLKSLIRKENKTAVIVSHDLQLAAEFADMIIPITFNTPDKNGARHGEILPENILHKGNSWKKGLLQPNNLDNITEYLNATFN